MSHCRMMVLAGLMLMGGAGAVKAQDSTAAQPQAQALRQRLQARYMARVKEELGLTDAEATKLQGVATSWFDKRRALGTEEQGLRKALAGQLRPGVAANADSVTHVLTRLLDLKVKFAETYRDENKDLGFLTPVQRAQYYSLRERLLEMVHRAQEGRWGGNGGSMMRRPGGSGAGRPYGQPPASGTTPAPAQQPGTPHS